MGNTNYFTSIYLCSGYCQCHTADEDIPKTAFLIRYCLYEWVVKHMGLTNAPAMLIHTMNNLFSDMLDFGIGVLMDDIFVYSHMVKEHFMLLEKSTGAFA